MFGKFFILFAIVAVAVCFPREKATEWANFKAKYNKFYALSEESEHFAAFSANLDKIKEHNKLYDEGKVLYKQGVTQFADLTKEQFLKYLKLQGGNPLKNAQNIYSAPVGEDLPESIDYRKQNAVNPIKNQGNCGSCWAFSATGVLEINNFLKNGVKLSLSEQELNDCSDPYGNKGCNGGLIDPSFDYIKDNGIAEDKDYPYKGIDYMCTFETPRSNVSVTGHTAIKLGDEGDLQSAVANVGAIALAVDATDLQLYDSGIMNGKYCCNERYCLNHAVVLIGYDSEDGQDYWIVRNSWGKSWGEDGYVRIAREGKNVCGIVTLASYPSIA